VDIILCYTSQTRVASRSRLTERTCWGSQARQLLAEHASDEIGFVSYPVQRLFDSLRWHLMSVERLADWKLYIQCSCSCFNAFRRDVDVNNWIYSVIIRHCLVIGTATDHLVINVCFRGSWLVPLLWFSGQFIDVLHVHCENKVR